MSAQPSSRYSSPSPGSARRLAPRARRSPRRDPHRTATLEAAVRLGVNLLLGTMAMAALIKLLPYNLAQQERLTEIRSEVAAIEGRVDRLQAEFDRNFDPQQTMNVMREQSTRLNPNQRQIIWVAPSAADTAQSLHHETGQSQQAFSPRQD